MAFRGCRSGDFRFSVVTPPLGAGRRLTKLGVMMHQPRRSGRGGEVLEKWGGQKFLHFFTCLFSLFLVFLGYFVCLLALVINRF